MSGSTARYADRLEPRTSERRTIQSRLNGRPVGDRDDVNWVRQARVVIDLVVVDLVTIDPVTVDLVAVELWGRLLFEAIDEPAPRGAEGAVGQIYGRHGNDMAIWWIVLEMNFNERAICEIRLHHVQRHDAKPEAGPQEVVLGCEVAKTPYFWRHDSKSAHWPQTRMIRVHELNVLAKDAHGNRRTIPCQWV